MINVLNNHYHGADWTREPRDLFVASDSNLFDGDSMGFSNISTQVDFPPQDNVRCYKTAIVGLNNTCDCCGCLKDFANKNIHSQARKLVIRHHLNIDPQSKSAFELPLKVVIVERKSSRHIINLKEIQQTLLKLNVNFTTVLYFFI